MNALRFLSLCVLLLLVAACSAGEEVEIETREETPVVITTEEGVGETVISSSLTNISTPTNTPTQLTPMPTPLTPTPTPTNHPTLTPQPSPTLTIFPSIQPPSPPSGYLLFLWDSQQILRSGISNPIQSLYQASPGKTIADWSIQPILTDLTGWPTIALSPNQAHIALTKVEDTNLDGHASAESSDRGFDAYNLFTYERDINTLQSLTKSNINSYVKGWLADNRTIVYSNSDQIFFTNLEDRSTRQIELFLIKQMGKF